MNTNLPAEGANVPQEPTTSERVDVVLNGPQEQNEADKRHMKVWNDLATAFGGYSQVPDNVIGMAIAGQINNNGLKFGPAQLDEVVDEIVERWELQDADADKIRNEIVGGMKKASEAWKEDTNNSIWPVLEAIES